MQPIKTKNHINFLKPQRSVARINYSLLSLAVFFVIGVSVGGYYLFNKESKKQSTVVPTAYASDIPVWWYQEHFGSSICDADFCRMESDPDSDKLTNSQEFYYQTDPYDTDTNDNGLTDGEDVAQNFVPSKPGKMTFEQAASDENIYAESLGFADDIENEFKKSWDISKVNIPLPSDAELTILPKSTNTKIYQDYVDNVMRVTERHFPNNQIDKAVNQINSDKDITAIKSKSINLATDLKKIAVPEDVLLLHKYNIALYQLLPDVLTPPPDEMLEDTSNVEANIWFSKTQAFLALTQKLDFEFEKLQR